VKAEIRGRIGLRERDAAEDHNGRWERRTLMPIGVRLVGRESRRLCVVNAEGRGGLADGLARGGGRFRRRERFAAAGNWYRMLIGRRERVRRRPNHSQYYKRS